MCDSEDRKEYDDSDQQCLRGKCGHQADKACYSLASPELHVERETVPDHSADCSVKAKESSRNTAKAEEQRADVVSEYAFADIAYKNNDARFLSEIPEYICGTRVAGTESSDINPLCSSVNIGCLEDTETVPCRKADESN